MKRDLELIRKMVLTIEDSSSAWAPSRMSFAGYSSSEVGYHAWLLIDAGLAKGNVTTDQQSDGPEAMITSLTWAGHEFADAARDDTRWQKAMGLVKEKGGAVTIAVLTRNSSSGS